MTAVYNRATKLEGWGDFARLRELRDESPSASFIPPTALRFTVELTVLGPDGDMNAR